MIWTLINDQNAFYCFIWTAGNPAGADNGDEQNNPDSRKSTEGR